jgi:hypothetical protein
MGAHRLPRWAMLTSRNWPCKMRVIRIRAWAGGDANVGLRATGLQPERHAASTKVLGTEGRQTGRVCGPNGRAARVKLDRAPEGFLARPVPGGVLRPGDARSAAHLRNPNGVHGRKLYPV